MMKWCCTWTFAVILWGLAGVATAKSVEWDPNGSGNWYGANRWKGGVTLTDADTDVWKRGAVLIIR